MNCKAAIIGLGIIGQSQVKLFGDLVHVTYDPKYEEPYPAAQIDECDFAVICVGTPQGDDGKADLTALYAAFSDLPIAMPVVIRSTVPPRTLLSLEEERLLVHVPEFMQEALGGLWPESEDVPFTILGGTSSARDYFRPVFRELAHWRLIPPKIYECSAVEAALIKYTANTYLATKVTFVNEIAGICKTLGADWESVREGWLCDPRVGNTHTEARGGFGGRCFPKDLSAIIYASETEHYHPEFLKAVRQANERFRRNAV